MQHLDKFLAALSFSSETVSTFLPEIVTFSAQNPKK
jgi:hypothetical protein